MHCMKLIRENFVTPSRSCYKIENGYEFISDSNDIMFTITQCASTLNFQNYTYFISKVSIKVNDAWVKTNEIKMHNSLHDFIETLKKSPNFHRAIDCFERLKKESEI